MNSQDIEFPINDFEKLIIDIGWGSLQEWIYFWECRKEILSINQYWGEFVKEDWIWGLALPLLSQAYKLKNNSSGRKLIGLSALPGTGKSTLGNWLESISTKLNFKIAVISIDDFYLPSKEMQLAIKDNPWDVSRGFPGSHSINLMLDTLIKWKDTGKLRVPVFDKSLRDGLGDRSHWREDRHDVLIIEGWLLGVTPLTIKSNDNELISPTLSLEESIYRNKIQENLKFYLDIWNLIDVMWHLKSIKFSYMNTWKLNQEKELLNKKGHALKDKKLSDFLRMLNVSIPLKSFDLIRSDILLLINQKRKLIKVGLN